MTPIHYIVPWAHAMNNTGEQVMQIALPGTDGKSAAPAPSVTAVTTTATAQTLQAQVILFMMNSH